MLKLMKKGYTSRRGAQSGFSMIEMMLAMLIGIIILSGVMAVYTNSRDAQRVSSDQIQLVADARFAIDTIAYDLRHAGMYGGNNLPITIKCYPDDPKCVTQLPTAVGDCQTRWYINIMQQVFASEGTSPYTLCPIDSHVGGTDLLEVRYADSTPVVTASLNPGTVYVRSNYQAGELFIGNNEPTIPDNTSPLSRNHQLYSRAYYVSSYTDTPGDNLPSLRRVNLVPGPIVQDELILQGVDDLQVQFGVDTDDDAIIDQYVNPDKVADWSKIQAARIWVVVRSEHADPKIDTGKTFTIAGVNRTFPNDGFRRAMASSVVTLRNMVRYDGQ